MDKDSKAFLNEEIWPFVEETFFKHHAIFTDKGTGLLDTLGEITHAQASVVLKGLNESIAGHVFHLTFYIKALRSYLEGTRTKIDWSESWTVRAVTEVEWKKEINAVMDEYAALGTFFKNEPEWDKDDNLGGILAIVVHSAYHLGAIRQMKELIKVSD